MSQAGGMNTMNEISNARANWVTTASSGIQPQGDMKELAFAARLRLPP